MIRHFADGLVQAEVTGDGKPVWLFHSLLADSGSCQPLAARLSPRFQVILPELPGFGGSAAAGPGLAAAADRMAAAMPGPGAIIANGYGTFVALMLALRHPHLATRMVLAGTGAAFSEPGRAAFRGMAAAAGSKGLEAIADTAMRRLFSPEFQDAHPDLLAERRERFLATDKAVFMDACTSLASLDIRAEVRTLYVPVLVLAGEQDEATPPAMARELASLLPNSRLIVMAGCAHVPQLQDTDGFMSEIGSFLE